MYSFINTYPKDREPGWSEELNGVTNDKRFWYFTRNEKKNAVSSV